MQDDTRTQHGIEGKSSFTTRTGLLTPHEHNHLEPRDIRAVRREGGRIGPNESGGDRAARATTTFRRPSTRSQSVYFLAAILGAITCADVGFDRARTRAHTGVEGGGSHGGCGGQWRQWRAAYGARG